jgi:hypothetical protein
MGISGGERRGVCTVIIMTIHRKASGCAFSPEAFFSQKKDARRRLFRNTESISSL